MAATPAATPRSPLGTDLAHIVHAKNIAGTDQGRWADLAPRQRAVATGAKPRPENGCYGSGPTRHIGNLKFGNESYGVSHFSPKLSVKVEGQQWRKTYTGKAAVAAIQAHGPLGYSSNQMKRRKT